MTQPAMLDCAVVGAGPAGLTAAIYLARFRRSFQVIDAGASRAAWIPRTRNLPGFPGGIAGKALLARIRQQAELYDAPIRPGRVEGIRIEEEGFQLVCDGEPLRARKVILATGVVDRTPDVPGLADAVATGRLHACPICDGYETIGRRVGVLGLDAHGAREALFLTNWSDQVCLIHLGPPDDLPDPLRSELATAGIDVLEGGVEGVVGRARIDGLRLKGGEVRGFDCLYAALGVTARNQLAVEAGAELDDSGRLVVDDHQQTTVPGLYAAGDVVRGLNQISTAEGEGAIAATHIHNTHRPGD